MSTENSPFYDTNNKTTTPITILNNSSSNINSSPRLSRNPFLSPTSSNYNQFLPTDFSTFSPSIFLPSTKSLSNSPSDCSFDEFSNAIATQNRLNQASFILENQQLYNNYTLCLATLQESIKELDALREENDNLRLANADLIHRLSLLSQATIQNCLLSSNHHSLSSINDCSTRFSIGNTTKAVPSISPTSVIEQTHLDKRNHEKYSLPKSISVRSSGYAKTNQPNGTGNRNRLNLTRNTTQRRVTSPSQNESVSSE